MTRSKPHQKKPQARTLYELNSIRQISIAESQSKILLGNDSGYINMGMTTRVASSDGKWQLIVSIALKKSFSLHEEEWS